MAGKQNKYVYTKYDSGGVCRKKSKKGKDKNAQSDKSGQFDLDHLNGFTLKETQYTVPSMKQRKRTRSAFDGVRREFLMHIGKNFEKELRNIGVNDAQLKQIQGGGSPVGFNVHHKLPIHGGGQNVFENLIFMPIKPHNNLHHNILDPQIAQIQEGESRKIMIPWSDNMVYVDVEKNKTFQLLNNAVTSKMVARR